MDDVFAKYINYFDNILNSSEVNSVLGFVGEKRTMLECLKQAQASKVAVAGFNVCK